MDDQWNGERIAKLRSEGQPWRELCRLSGLSRSTLRGRYRRWQREVERAGQEEIPPVVVIVWPGERRLEVFLDPQAAITALAS